MYLLHSSSTQPYLLSEDISKDLSKNGPKKKGGGHLRVPKYTRYARRKAGVYLSDESNPDLRR